MNASSTCRSESTGYFNAVSRMVVDAAGMTPIRVLMNADTRRLVRRTCSPASRRKQQRIYPHVDSTRSRHLGRTGTPVRSRLRAGGAADGTRSSRACGGCAATHPVAAKLNLNTATVAELDKAPQIGPTRSKAIVEARSKEKFKNWDDL